MMEVESVLLCGPQAPELECLLKELDRLEHGWEATFFEAFSGGVTVEEAALGFLSMGETECCCEQPGCIVSRVMRQMLKIEALLEGVGHHETMMMIIGPSGMEIVTLTTVTLTTRPPVPAEERVE